MLRGVFILSSGPRLNMNMVFPGMGISIIKIGRSSDRLNLIMGILGAVSIRKTVLPGMAIPMLKIRRPNGRVIFNMEIAIRR